MHRSTNLSPAPRFQCVTPRAIDTAERVVEAGWSTYADSGSTQLRDALRDAVWQLEDEVDVAVDARMCLHADVDGVAVRCTCAESAMARAVVTVAQLVGVTRGAVRA